MSAGYVSHPLTCGECGETGTKRVSVTADVVCTACGTETNYIDYIMQLDAGEALAFVDGVLHVQIPQD